MGSSKSTLKKYSKEIQDLKNEMQALRSVDKNHDGVITKEEFTDWQKKQKTKMEEIEAKLEKEITNKYSKLLSEKDIELSNTKNKLDELTKQLNSLKTINTGLEKQAIETNEHKTVELDKIQELSKAKIDEFIEKLLADEKVNIGYLPDFVERQLYRNIFNMLIGLLKNVLSTTNIGLLGHQLTFSIQPEQ